MISLVASTEADIPLIASHLREADAIESAALGLGRSPAEALVNALASSLWSLTALVDGQPHAMMGVSPRNMMEGIGVPWMLGTDRIYDHARDLVRYSPAILGEMRATFATLENLVSAGNAKAIRYLRHVGFEICDEVIMVAGTEFLHFRMGAT